MHAQMTPAEARRSGGSCGGATPYARQHTRFVVNLPVRCSRMSARATGLWHGRTTNVSGGGLAVKLPKRLPPGTALAVEIRTGIGPMRVEAEVVWTGRVASEPGLVQHGLRFANASELLDFPVGVLLGQWLQRRAREEPRRRAQLSRAGKPGGGKA